MRRALTTRLFLLVFLSVALLSTGLSAAAFASTADHTASPADPSPANPNANHHEIRDLKAILAAGKIRVAMLKSDEIPFFYHNANGEFTGVDVELLALLEDALGVEVELLRVPSTFDGVVDMVADGRADLGMSYLSVTIERAKRVNYTIPYAYNYFAVAVNRVAEARSRTGGDIKAFLNSKETRLGLQLNSSYETFARRAFPRASLVGISDSTASVLAVGDSEVDATVSAKLTLEPLLKHHPKLNFSLRTIVFHDEPDLMAAVVHPDNPHLLNWMNVFLRQMDIMGTLKKIMVRHGINPE